MVARGVLKMAVVGGFVIFAAPLAWAGPPRLNIKATCKRAQPLSSGAEISAYQSCINDETEAQKELAKKWSTFSARPQATCTSETELGGAPSYVELLTCLELNKQARAASRENAKALKVPGVPKAAPPVKPKLE